MFDWATPPVWRPLPPVIVPMNVVLRGGIDRAERHRHRGRDPPDVPLNWTDADRSLG